MSTIPTTPRWAVRAAYLTSGDTLIREASLEELADLGDWIENGPDRAALLGLVVTYVPALPQPLSDEEVARLKAA